MCLFNTQRCVFFLRSGFGPSKKRKKKQCIGTFDEAGIRHKPGCCLKAVSPSRDKEKGRWAEAALVCAFLSYQRPANAKVKQKEDIADLLWVYPENPTVLDICPQGKGLPDVFVPFPTLHTVLRSVLIINTHLHACHAHRVRAQRISEDLEHGGKKKTGSREK